MSDVRSVSFHPPLPDGTYRRGCSDGVGRVDAAAQFIGQVVFTVHGLCDTGGERLRYHVSSWVIEKCFSHN